MCCYGIRSGNIYGWRAWVEHNKCCCHEHPRFIIPQSWSLDDVALSGMLFRSIYIACSVALRFICKHGNIASVEYKMLSLREDESDYNEEANGLLI